MIRTPFFALIAGATLATAAAAQEAGREHPILRLDTNGDGQVSLEELQAMPANPMALADADGDGTLTRDEIVAAAVERATARATERAGAMFDRYDEDGNGEIAVDNLPEPRRDMGDRLERMFERADANDDGVLSAEEIADLPERGGRGFGRGDGHGGRRG